IPAVPEEVDPERVKGTPGVDAAPEVDGTEPKKEAPKPEVEVEAKEAKLPPLPRVTHIQTKVAPTPISQLSKICISPGEMVKLFNQTFNSNLLTKDACITSPMPNAKQHLMLHLKIMQSPTV